MIFTIEELAEQGQIVQDNAGLWRWTKDNRFDFQPGSMLPGNTPGRKFNSETGAIAGAVSKKPSTETTKPNPFMW